MTADSAAASKNGHNNDFLPASPPPSTSERTAEPGHQPNMTQEGSRAIPVEISPRRSSGLSKCNVCDTKFTICNHRHMCRMCQDPVCNQCLRSRKVFRAGTKPKRVCDDCVKTFPLTTKIISDTTNTIESGNRPPLSLSALDAVDTCAEQTMLFPGPVTAFFGIGMVGMPSPRTLPPPSTGGENSAPTPLATAFARLQVETINGVFFGGRRASGDNVGKKKPGVQIAATTEMETLPSSFSPPPVQQQDWAQGGMRLVTNGGQGQAESESAGPDFDCVMSATAVVPAVAADEVQKVTYNEVPLQDAEASHAQVTNQAGTFNRAVLELDVSHFASTTADTPTNYYTPAAAAPAYHKAEVQKPVQNEVAAEDADALCSHEINKGDTVDGALVELEVTAAESTVDANSTPFFAAYGPLTATLPSPSTTASPSQDQEVERNEIASKA